MPDEIRRIANPPEIMWAENRSLLLTLRHAQRVLRTDLSLTADLLALTHADARQIIEDADLVIKASVRTARASARSSTTWPRASRASWTRMTMPRSGRRPRRTEGLLDRLLGFRRLTISPTRDPRPGWADPAGAGVLWPVL